MCSCSTANEVEAIVQSEGATPATVGVIQGKIHVGLSPGDLEHLAQCRNALKVSRRDLPYVISKVRLLLYFLWRIWLPACAVSLPLKHTTNLFEIQIDCHCSMPWRHWTSWTKQHQTAWGVTQAVNWNLEFKQCQGFMSSPTFSVSFSGSFRRNNCVGHYDCCTQSGDPCFCHGGHWRGSQRWTQQ